MRKLKPKEQHERLLANIDKEKIRQYLLDGQDRDVTRTAVTLAQQCHLYVHFVRLWKMRVSDLDAKFSTEQYMKHIYVNRRSLSKELRNPEPPQ